MDVGPTLSSAPGTGRGAVAGRAGRTVPARGSAVAAIAAAGAVAVAAAATALIVGIRRVSVEGDSMRPALVPGDRLLVARLPRPLRVPPGAVVATVDPRRPQRLLVKRVASVEPDGHVVVRGDNGPASTDSRTFGPVPRRSVWGVAWYRYAPPERAGRLTRLDPTDAPTDARRADARRADARRADDDHSGADPHPV